MIMNFKEFAKNAKKYCVIVMAALFILPGSMFSAPPVIDDGEVVYYQPAPAPPVIEDITEVVTPALTLQPLDLPIAIEPVQPRRWAIGSSYITPRELDPTTITDVVTLETNDGFAIHASSPISDVNHFVLDDRVVIDIYNSSPYSDGYFYGIPDIVSGVRMAAQYGFTRVVLDMEFIPNYSLRLSYDRTRLYIQFSATDINYISFHSTYENDYIVIIGEDTAPAFGIDQYLQYTLTVTMPLATFEGELESPVLEGQFFDHIEVRQIGQNVEIVIRLRSDISYTYDIIGNMINIVIGPATHKNITINRADSTILLHGTEQASISLDNITIYHYYRDLRHVFSLDGDYSHHFGYGRIQFESAYSSFIDIVTYNGRTSIIVTGPNITFANISEQEYEVPYEEQYEEYEEDYPQEDVAMGIMIRTFSPRSIYSHIVMLDPGHGGEDPGAVHFGYHEADLVLTISNMVYDMLRQNPNVGVFATRETDVFVTLIDRAELSNDVVDLFVSIHMNAFHTSTPQGTEVYYLPNDTEHRFNITREQTARIFQDNLLEDLGTTDRGIRIANFAVLRYTEMPSVLLELGFMSNPEDMRILSDPHMHTVMATSIYRSILEVFDTFSPPR